MPSLPINSSASKPLIEDLLERLARGERADLGGLLHDVETDGPISGTRVRSHCHLVALDGNGRPRVAELVRRVAHHVLAYAIPRSAVAQAIEKYKKTGSSADLVRLQNQARSLFTKVKTSGEGGELLLFALAELYLKLPQLMCKMDLKTSTEMHFHGADGLHCGPGDEVGNLALYWCESKIYTDFSSAVKDCLGALAKMLLSEGGTGSSTDRDLQILDRKLDLSDSELEEALGNYLDPNHPNFNALEMRGICLVGFDCAEYPTKSNTASTIEIRQAIEQLLPDWKSRIGTRVKSENIESFVIHFICLPLPAAENFRSLMAKELSLQNADS